MMAVCLVRAKQDEDESSEEALCAICFEHMPFVAVPCSCRVNYCAFCWDRSLAASVAMRGVAQCPSCRGTLRVDFDPEARSLVFSREAECSTPLEDWRGRLYKKAKPVQIQLLQDMGKAITAAPSAAPQCVEPRCVCGAMLERVDRRARILRMLEDTEPAWRSRVVAADRLVKSLSCSSLITCDLCDEVATRTGYVWTCKNGPHTVLHPAAYDVCEQCFARYSGLGQAAALSSPPAEPGSPQGLGCWHTIVPWPRLSIRSMPSTQRRLDSLSVQLKRTMSAVVMGLRSSVPASPD